MDKEFRRKVVVSYMLLPFLLSLTIQPFSFAQTISVKQLIIAMLNNVRSCEFEYHRKVPTREEAVLVGFHVTGEEVVTGESAWKVHGWVTSGEEGGEGLLWISKSTGATLMVQIGDEVATGEQAELVAAVFLNLLAFAVGDLGALKNATASQYGKVSLIGYGVEEFGATRLLVYKWRYEGYETAPPEYRFRQEVWIAPMSFGYLLARLRFEKYDGTESGGFDLLSITLANPQPLPNVTIRAEANRTLVKPGEEVAFIIACVNTGAASGIYNLTASVDGEVRESWLLELKPGESKNIIFRALFTGEGEHVVKIGDETFTISVKQTPPAKLEVSGLRIEPETPKAGEQVTITVTVKNTGGETGTRDIALRIGGTILESENVTLGPGESRTLTFRFLPEGSGVYWVAVDGFNATVTVGERGAPSPEVSPHVPAIFAASVAAVAVAIAVVIMRKRAARLPPPP